MRKAIAAAPVLGPYAELARSRVNVFVPGDGCRPYTAAAMCLLSGDSWRAWSIDPAMKKEYCEGEGRLGPRLVCARAMSQDFPMPTLVRAQQPSNVPCHTWSNPRATLADELRATQPNPQTDNHVRVLRRRWAASQPC